MFCIYSCPTLQLCLPVVGNVVRVLVTVRVSAFVRWGKVVCHDLQKGLLIISAKVQQSIGRFCRVYSARRHSERLQGLQLPKRSYWETVRRLRTLRRSRRLAGLARYFTSVCDHSAMNIFNVGASPISPYTFLYISVLHFRSSPYTKNVTEMVKLSGPRLRHRNRLWVSNLARR